MDIIKFSKGGGGTMYPNSVIWSGTKVIGHPKGNWVPTKGFWNVVYENNDVSFQLLVSGTWYGSGDPIQGTHYCDGVNMRFQSHSDGEDKTLYVQQLG